MSGSTRCLYKFRPPQLDLMARRAGPRPARRPVEPNAGCANRDTEREKEPSCSP